MRYTKRMFADIDIENEVIRSERDYKKLGIDLGTTYSVVAYAKPEL